MNGVCTPVSGSTERTRDTPAGNGKPLKSETNNWWSEWWIPVGTASSVGPPKVGKSGFGILAKVVSVENAPDGISTLHIEFCPPSVTKTWLSTTTKSNGLESRTLGGKKGSGLGV